jgi:hypothetical protein
VAVEGQVSPAFWFRVLFGGKQWICSKVSGFGRTLGDAMFY